MSRRTKSISPIRQTPLARDGKHGAKARRGKMTRRERRSIERKRVMAMAESYGHPHDKRPTVKAEREIRAITRKQPGMMIMPVQTLSPMEMEAAAKALIKQQRRERIANALITGYHEARKREAIKMGEIKHE